MKVELFALLRKRLHFSAKTIGPKNLRDDVEQLPKLSFKSSNDRLTNELELMLETDTFMFKKEEYFISLILNG